MSNLTTRKIVLGMLMVLVLAFSVQGIADAVSISPSTSPSDLTTVTMGSTITLRSIRGSLNLNTAAENVTVAISGTATANFPDPGDGVTPFTGDTYTEQATTSVTVLNNGSGNGTIDIPSSLVITASTAGTVIVTVTWTPRVSTDTKRKVFSFYVVPDSSISAIAPMFINNDTVGYRVGVNEVEINPILTVGDDLPLHYSVSGGSLSVKIGTRTRAVGSNITSSTAPVSLKMNGRTSVVSVYVEGHGSARSARATIIYRFPRFQKVSGDSPKQVGAPSSRIRHPFTVQVRDGSGTSGNVVPGQAVTFVTDVSGSTFSAHSDFPDSITTTNIPEGNPQTTISGQTATVITNSQGNASVFLVFGSSAEEHTVTAGIGSSGTPAALQVKFKAEAIDLAEARSITKVADTDGQRADAFGNVEKPLTVVVRDQGGNPKQGEDVTFSDRSGGTVGPPIPENGDPGAHNTGVINTTRTRVVTTNANGEASVNYTAREEGGVHTVAASITIGGYKETLFTINGTGSTRTGSLNITVSGTGATRSVTVNAVSAAGTPTAIPAVLTGTATSTQTIITGTATEITLPTAPGSYTLTATASVAGYNPDTETITVAGPTSLGTISISQIGTPTNGVQTFSITVRRTDGTTPAPLTVTVSGTGFTTSSVPTANGSGAVNIALPTTAGLYTLTARATGYTSGPTTVRIAGTGQQQQQQQPAQQQPAQQQPTVSEPDSISIIGPSTRSGTVNEELDTPLLVRVLDDDGDGLEGARVFYRVTGRGRISDGSRGGRSIGVITDDDGYARANFTPTAGGSSTVRVNTDDVSRIVTFTITTGSASSASGARDSGTGGTPGTISPVVHVGAASRPPMLWVDGGAIYALVGASPQRFAPGVDNALNITVGGGKVYWTEKTGDAGTINSANLNGSDVAELTSIKAVPMGIAVDVAGSKLYWTNSRGRIQSADLDGSGITNVMQNLPSPMDLALAGGNAYWTQGNGSVRFVNLRGQKVVRNISTGTDTPGSLVIGGGKVYWTEMTGESGGTVNSANLNGTGATPLASILAAPIGIAVDGSRSKLYWTNSRGRVQSANLDGSGIKNVVSGLGSPSELVLSNSIAAPTATPTTTRSTTTASKYDVNSDGSVNNADSDAITVAIAAGATDAKYDVNGDGKVNVFDLVEIIANRDPGAAGAPTLFGMKMSAAQIDSLQEQIDLLIAMNDRSPAALRTLIYLQQLLVTARPEKTLLLANYPNPFNPETWIPYELATDTDVRLTIYNTQGVVIRSLQLGHQSAGYYTGRDRAAYWDGRNSVGEQVASGLYFYQLETDEMSLMRKMVILK